MGEAWFLGKRVIFSELAGDPTSLDDEFLARVFREIGSGLYSFGAVDPQWSAWCRFLLPAAMKRMAERGLFPLYELYVTSFINAHWLELPEIYPEFRLDCLDTVGVALMDPSNWRENGAPILGRLLARFPGDRAELLWSQGGGDFSAAMYFCLKFLPSDQVDDWFASVTRIRTPPLLCRLLVWLGATLPRFHVGQLYPVTLTEWESSESLGMRRAYDRPLLPPDNLEAFRRAVRRHATADWLLDCQSALQTDSAISRAVEAYSIIDLALGAIAGGG